MTTWTVQTGDSLDLLRAVPSNSIDAVLCDPPYELGFMGKGWDSSGIAYSIPLWAEVLRVLKPGGHLAAFGATRTYHRLAVAIEDAGFEIRDSLHWTYGSGFPKNLDVAKAIDKQRDDRSQVLRVTGFLADARDKAGLTNRDIDTAFGTAGMAGHWTSTKSQPAVPTVAQWERLKGLLGFPDSLDSLVVHLNSRKGTPGEAFTQREVIGVQKSSLGGTVAAGERDPAFISAHKAKMVPVTAPGSPQAAEWAGWGTALKPAHEPIVLARKPLQGTVAANVLKWGTGALNIGAARVGSEVRTNAPAGTLGLMDTGTSMSNTGSAVPTAVVGRWPSNVLYGHGTACTGDSCAPGCPVAVLDEQSRTPQGGASRFFPVIPVDQEPPPFAYIPKPSRKERDAGLDTFPITRREQRDDVAAGTWAEKGPQPGRNTHVTVKPAAVMQWLTRLLVPKGGTILDPFTGSGTTGVAAVLEGCDFVGFELDPVHTQIATARIRHAETHPEAFLVARTTTDRVFSVGNQTGPAEAPVRGPEVVQAALFSDDTAA